MFNLQQALDQHEFNQPEEPNIYLDDGIKRTSFVVAKT